MGGADGHHPTGHPGQGLVSARGEGLGGACHSGAPPPPCPCSPRPSWASLCPQVRSQARLRVQVPAVRPAPVLRTCPSGDLPARPSDDPAEERRPMEGGAWPGGQGRAQGSHFGAQSQPPPAWAHLLPGLVFPQKRRKSVTKDALRQQAGQGQLPGAALAWHWGEKDTRSNCPEGLPQMTALSCDCRGSPLTAAQPGPS